jgi:hypothetical protein
MKVILPKLPSNIPAVYISGPMSGIPDNNVYEFVKMHHKIEGFFRNSAVIKNPALIINPSSKSYEELMRICLGMLIECTHIVMLEGWEKSSGALVERHIADVVGITDITHLLR